MNERPLHNNTLRVAGREIPCAVDHLRLDAPTSWDVSMYVSRATAAPVVDGLRGAQPAVLTPHGGIYAGEQVPVVATQIETGAASDQGEIHFVRATLEIRAA